MAKLNLENVTLVCVSSIKVRESIKALKWSYKSMLYRGGVFFKS